MATTIQPATADTTKQLINYRTDTGVAVIEMADPPANTYTYEMNRQLDEAILKARMDNDVYVIVLTGSGRQVFFRRGEYQNAVERGPNFQILFLPSCKRNAAASGTHAKAGYRRAERPLRRRRPRNCNGRRPSNRAERCGEKSACPK